MDEQDAVVVGEVVEASAEEVEVVAPTEEVAVEAAPEAESPAAA